MKLTRASSYAIHAVVSMAAQKNKAPVASHDTARAQHIPERFLLKVLRPLVGARILYSVKGPNGGYRLARPASDISLLEVVEAVDGPIRGMVPYIEGTDSKLEKRLEPICNRIAEETRRYLQKTSIADLASRGKKN